MSSRAKVFRIRGTELWSLVERSARSFPRHDMAVYAMALAYRGLFALFPLSCQEHPF
jgi:uncharacterized BrkB/YihY/UPF0761 family membrane protein